jgi:hypothetical protein
VHRCVGVRACGVCMCHDVCVRVCVSVRALACASVCVCVCARARAHARACEEESRACQAGPGRNGISQTSSPGDLGGCGVRRFQQSPSKRSRDAHSLAADPPPPDQSRTSGAAKEEGPAASPA